MTDSLSPEVERLAVAVAALLDEMPDDRRRELATLAALSDDPADVVLSVRYREDLDGFDVVWVGRVIGTVSRPWLLSGVVPDDFPQVDGGLP